MKIFLITLLFMIFTLTTAMAAPPKNIKSKFYTFNLIEKCLMGEENVSSNGTWGFYIVKTKDNLCF